MLTGLHVCVPSAWNFLLPCTFDSLLPFIRVSAQMWPHQRELSQPPLWTAYPHCPFPSSGCAVFSLALISASYVIYLSGFVVLFLPREKVSSIGQGLWFVQDLKDCLEHCWINIISVFTLKALASIFLQVSKIFILPTFSFFARNMAQAEAMWISLGRLWHADQKGWRMAKGPRSEYISTGWTCHSW